MSLRNAAAIIGLGIGSLGLTRRSALALHAEAASLAIADAGLQKQDIDGVLLVRSWEMPQLMPSAVFGEYFGLRPAYSNTLALGGATPCALVAHAAMAIQAGLCHNVLCVAASNRASHGRDATVSVLADAVGHPEFESPYGPLIPALYALVAQRHMYEFGTTPEQLAAVAVLCRENAARTPYALMKKPIGIADVLASKMIASPLHMLDCCLANDYGAALVVTGRERAVASPRPPIWLLGYGEGHTHEHISQAPSLTSFGAVQSGGQAFAMAGLDPTQVDVAQLYDCFTIAMLVELEDLGFCAKGEAGALVESGRLSLKGDLPTNTNGGMLSATTGGMFHIIEAVQQLRGEAEGRQVPAASVALVHGNGGIFSTHTTLILGAERA